MGITETLKRLKDEDIFYGIQMRSLWYWDDPQREHVISASEVWWAGSGLGSLDEAKELGLGRN